MRIAVLGTGISGLSVAQLLKASHNVTLFEKKKEIGGLIKCERVNDCLFHKVGGHVFNAKNEAVFNWFWSFFDKDNEFIKAKRNAKVFFAGKVIGYPVENYLYSLPKEITKEIISELIALQQTESKKPFEYANFQEFLEGNFGKTLYKSYFQPYNQKIWRTNLKDVAMEWLEGKLPMPNYKEIITSNIVREEEDTMVHSSFYYPKNEGSQFIVNRLSEGLDVKCSFDPESITIENDEKIRIAGEGDFEKLIYTGDVRNLPQTLLSIVEKEGISVEQLKALKSNGTSNLFCETDDNDISWLYIPEDFTRAHRIIYTGNFSESNNRGSKRRTCVVEFSGKVEYEEMCEEIKKLPGNLSPISHNYEANSYVIQDHHTRTLIHNVKKVLEKNNVFLLGRFAEWEYYNMDKAIESAVSLSTRIDI